MGHAQNLCVHVAARGQFLRVGSANVGSRDKTQRIRLGSKDLYLSIESISLASHLDVYIICTANFNSIFFLTPQNFLRLAKSSLPWMFFMML